MQKRQLKRLIETGHYRPEPAQVAEAMLERRAVRELLTGQPAPRVDGGLSMTARGALSLNPADRIQSPSAAPPRAA